MLSVNITEVILAIISFLLMFFLLKHFLYTPVIRFMDERKSRIDAGLAEEKRVLEAIDAAEQEAAGRRAEADSRAGSIVSAAMGSGREAEREMLDRTKAKLDEYREQSLRDSEDRRTAELADISGCGDKLGAALAEKIFACSGLGN